MTGDGAARRWSARVPRGGQAVLVGALLVFSTGVGTRSGGPLWDLVYDVVLYNVVYVAGAVVAWQVARRVPAERNAWRALALAFMLSTAANLWYSLVLAGQETVLVPSVADVLYLAAYPALYVALLSLIRSRVARFHASMWLDGVIGALAAVAISVAFLLAPALQVAGVGAAEYVTNLAYPVADVLLLAVLVAVAAILGVRGDRTLVWIGVGLLANLVGDVVFLNLASSGTYVEGGPLDLTWLVGVTAMSWAAEQSRRSTTPRRLAGGSGESRTGLRVLIVPFVCVLASLALLGAGWGDSYSDVAAWCAVGCVLTGLARTAVTFREVRDFHEVKAQAHTDELTGLPNRRVLLARADQVLRKADTVNPAALLLLDLDGFKEVNDGFGHHAGDELLRQVGPRLEGLLRPGDVLARLGGDEFALLLPDTDVDGAIALAEAVYQALRQPMTVEGVRLHVGASIGVATAPVPANSVSELLRCADIAMYAAKSARSGVRVYAPEPANDLVDVLRTMDELRVALQGEEIVVHLQPQVRLDDGAVVGVEALVRWQHPARGLLSPADLLPAADKAGLMRQLAAHVLDQALGAAAQWWGSVQVPVSVNLAVNDVTDLDLPDEVQAALARHGLPPQALTLELVEDTLMTDPVRGGAVLGSLRALGVRISIDDYGTGYSSLAYIDQLPADELKLDRSFITALSRTRPTTAVIRHTTALAHELGLTVVAEGVEDLALLSALAQLGCDAAQGYAIARPMPADEFPGWLAARTAASPMTSIGVHTGH